MKHNFCIILICLIPGVFSTTFTIANVTEGLLAYWPLNEGSGEVAHDVVGNYDGTLDNGPSWTGDSKMGAGALLFDGVDDRVSIDSFDVEGGSGITIACWFKASNLDTPGNDPRMVSKAIGGNNEDHWFMLSSSRQGNIKILRFRLRTDGVTDEKKAHPDGTIELDVWIHAAVTWDGSTMRIYKNGVEVGNMPKAGKLDVDPGVKMAIGNQPDGAENRPFNGVIDDVAIWNRPLTPEELIEVMTNGLPAAVEANGKLTIAWGAIKD